jgi:hypothetical protein
MHDVGRKLVYVWDVIGESVFVLPAHFLVELFEVFLVFLNEG